jgi:drug/metabolite transporter (DMT)-like permease
LEQPLKHNKVSSITVYYLMIPVFGTLLSALILGESIVRLQYVIALPAVAMGIYLVNGQSADLMKKSI